MATASAVLVFRLLWVVLTAPALCLSFTERSDWRASCLQSPSCWPSVTCQTLLGDEYRDGSWPICGDRLRSNNCLVYSFGIADDWTFDKLMGSFGCEVHSFDPTVDLPERLAPNVTFHQWGLRGRNTTRQIAAEAKQTYGQQLGPLYTLQEIRQLLNHHQELSVLKVDCEGCEWDFFGGFVDEPSNLPSQLAIEFHFSQTYGIKHHESFQDISAAFEVLAKAEYERFYWHDNAGYPWTRDVSEVALKAGFPEGSCCREMVFQRKQKLTAPLHHRASSGLHNRASRAKP